MRKKESHLGGRLQESGASIIVAIFLLLLMGSLAAFMTNLISVSNSNLAADIGGARAYQAARAGAEWAMYQLDPNASTNTLPSCTGASGTLTIVPNHSVVVTCTAYPSDTTAYVEGSKTIRIFHIVAVATATGVKLPGIERQIEVTVEKCRDPAITAAPYDC